MAKWCGLSRKERTIPTSCWLRSVYYWRTRSEAPYDLSRRQGASLRARHPCAPRENRSAPPTRLNVQQSARPTMHKILLVEDNEMNRDMLSRRLERKGYKVVLALDGQQALALAQSESPTLILMDMSLPLLDGWQATRRLKAANPSL